MVAAPETHPVDAMFGRIAARYDRANTVLSMGIHVLWRRWALDLLDPRPGERIADICCGTGDMTFALARAVGRSGAVAGVDFCAPMLEVARDRARALGSRAPSFLRGDALALPFEDDRLDAAVCAFGIRNVDDPAAAVAEMRRVVRPGGRLLILEFGQPDAPVIGAFYRFYSGSLMPRLGALVTGHRDPYEYLPRTAALFPAGERFTGILDRAGLVGVRAVPHTFGVAWSYRADVPADPAPPIAAGAPAMTTVGHES